MNIHYVKRRRQGISLVEVLVVIAIIGIVVGISIPAVIMVRERTRSTQCSNQIRNLGIAFAAYQTNHNVFPRNTNYHSIFVTMLPYLEQQSLFDSIDLQTVPTTATENARPKILVCPSEIMNIDQPILNTLSSYTVNIGNPFAPERDGALALGLNYLGLKPGDFVDGLSATCVFGEFSWYLHNVGGNENSRIREVASAPDIDVFRKAILNAPAPTGAPAFRNQWCFWPTHNHVMRPNEPCGIRVGGGSARSLSSYHGGGANVSFADGHVKFISENIDIDVWRAMGTRNKRDLVSD